jgi:hypothetical protein
MLKYNSSKLKYGTKQYIAIVVVVVVVVVMYHNSNFGGEILGYVSIAISLCNSGLNGI